MPLFRHQKANITRQTHQDLYYRQVFIEKRLYDGIEFLAKMNRTSRRQVCNELIELGFGTYLAREISRNNDAPRTARKENRPVQPTPFIVKYRRWIKSKEGVDISSSEEVPHGYQFLLFFNNGPTRPDG